MQSKDIEMFRGDSREFMVEMTDTVPNGVCLGGSLTMTVKADKDDSDDDSVIQHSVFLSLVPGSNVKYQGGFVITPTESNIEVTKYVFDVQFQSANKLNVKTIVIGTIKILTDITRTV